MHYQDYQIVLSSDLELTPKEFATVWNASPECRAISEAQLKPEKGTAFEPVTLTVILISVGTEIAAHALYDLVKGLVQKAHAEKQQQASQQQSPQSAKPHKH